MYVELSENRTCDIYPLKQENGVWIFELIFHYPKRHLSWETRDEAFPMALHAYLRHEETAEELKMIKETIEDKLLNHKEE